MARMARESEKGGKADCYGRGKTSKGKGKGKGKGMKTHGKGTGKKGRIPQYALGDGDDTYYDEQGYSQ